uniref:WAP domain-containing protein n=1 Tax=Pseudonaja textilis TaxID=8673 RepID=A0A670YM24_PSETE
APCCLLLAHTANTLQFPNSPQLSHTLTRRYCPEEVRKCPTKGQYECNNDSECKKNKKCCFSNCALRCVEPHQGNSSGEY